MKPKGITFKIPMDEYKELKRISAKKGVSMSNLIKNELFQMIEDGSFEDNDRSKVMPTDGPLDPFDPFKDL